MSDNRLEEKSDVDPRAVVAPTIAFELGLGVLALAVGHWLGQTPWELIYWNRAADWAWGLLATVPPLVAMALMARIKSGPLGQLNQLAEKLIRDLFRGCTLAEFALIALAAGLGEELFFRGVVQYLATEHLGLWSGLVFASVVFGLAHPMSRAYVVVAGIIGLYLGGLWIYFGNLLVPILTHAAYDFVALWYLTRRAKKLASGDASLSD